jgi:hypothetical protein
LLVAVVELNIEIKAQLTLEMEVLEVEQMDPLLAQQLLEQLTLVVVEVQVEELLQMVELEEVAW